MLTQTKIDTLYRDTVLYADEEGDNACATHVTNGELRELIEKLAVAERMYKNRNALHAATVVKSYAKGVLSHYESAQKMLDMSQAREELTKEGLYTLNL